MAVGWRKRARWKRRVPVFLAVSLAAHVGMLASLPAGLPADAITLDLELLQPGPQGRGDGVASTGQPTVGRGAWQTPREVRLPRVAQSRTSSALDHGQPGASASAGGEISILMADRDQGISVVEQLPNNLGLTQFQRIATARDRSSLIDDRLTPHPDEDRLLLSGRGGLREMVRARARSAARGGTQAPDPTASAPSEGVPAEPVAAAPLHPAEGASPAQTIEAASGLQAPAVAAPGGEALQVPDQQGIAEGALRAAPPVDGAAVAHVRPELHQGRPATPSEDHEGHLRDNRWSELLVSSLHRGYVTASDPGGGRGAGEGAGVGGHGAGRLGQGGGGRSAAGAGLGDETWISINSPDPRFLAFFRDMHRKVDPLWRRAFPRDAELDLEQGMCILGFTVHRDGRVTGIHVRRRSGFPEFDRRVQDALRQAAPFGPIPRSLGVDRLLVTAPFEFSNPLFR